MRLGFIGAGKVGTTLARAWQGAGYTIEVVYSRTPANAHQLANTVGARVERTSAAVVQAADLTFLTVPDDMIELLAGHIASVSDDLTDKCVVHTSGAHTLNILSPLAKCGAVVGSLHPALPFADVDAALNALPGTTFAVEADDEQLRSTLSALVTDIGGRSLTVPTDHKALYHAALVIASNYTVTLYNMAETLLSRFSDDPEVARVALNRLVQATVVNLEQQGTPGALTGPLVRGDVRTIAAHLQALDGFDADYTEVYRLLARQSYRMLEQRGTSTSRIELLLEQGQDDHGTKHDS